MGRGGERYGGAGAGATALNAAPAAPGAARAPPGKAAPGRGAAHHRRRSSGSAAFKAEHLEVLTLFHTLSLFCNLLLLYIFGSLRDFWVKLVHGAVHKSEEGYAPLCWDFEDFFVRRMYRRICDCFNRPICSAPGAWTDVLIRSSTDGNETLKFTGEKRRCLNLGSYNYLGFAAADPYCTPRVIAALRKYGWSTNSQGSYAGSTDLHREAERVVSEFLGVEDCLIYGMGFATNSLTIPLLMGKGCLVLSDEFNHKSIVEGIRHSGSKVKVFNHNDMTHLEQLLRSSIAHGQPRTRRPWKKVVIIVEGIYSMEGEFCPLNEVVALKKKYKAYLYLDEAHSIGAIGKTGRGVCQHFGVDPRDVDVMMGTFTKSFGSCGGYIGGPKGLVDFVKRTSPGTCYAVPMAPPCTEQIISSMGLIDGKDGTSRGQDKVASLHRNANFFRRELALKGFQVLGDIDSPVMPVLIYHSAKISAFSRMCLANNLALVVVGFPATGLFLTRARICISAAHSVADLNYALEIITRHGTLCGFRYFGDLADKGLIQIPDALQPKVLGL